MEKHEIRALRSVKRTRTLIRIAQFGSAATAGGFAANISYRNNSTPFVNVVVFLSVGAAVFYVSSLFFGGALDRVRDRIDELEAKE